MTRSRILIAAALLLVSTFACKSDSNHNGAAAKSGPEARELAERSPPPEKAPPAEKPARPEREPPPPQPSHGW